MANYISPEEAVTRIQRYLNVPDGVEHVRVSRARGRVLAQAVTAPENWPPFRRAAMDGYAFRSHESPGTLRVAGTLFAGQTWRHRVKPGEAVRIMTGAPLPSDLDTVLEQEAVSEGPYIAVLSPVAANRNVMTAGHEYRAGDIILDSGAQLDPLALGQAASMGLREVAVYAKPRVLIVVTGNEVVPGGRPLPSAHIYDASGPMLQALVEELGAAARLRYAPDNPRKLAEILGDVNTPYDLIITTGGVSVGQRDYLPELLRTQFARLFWHVDMHPGKAMAAGVGARGVPVLSLSGNPGAALTAWYLVAAPVVALLTRRVYRLTPVTGRLLAPYPKPTRETRYLKARFVATDGGLGFDLSPNQSSDALRSFAEADGLVVIPRESPPQPAGQFLTALALRGLARP